MGSADRKQDRVGLGKYPYRLILIVLSRLAEAPKYSTESDFLCNLFSQYGITKSDIAGAAEWLKGYFDEHRLTDE